MSPTKKKSDPVRLQVPVTRELAERIADLGTRMHTTQRRMAGVMLDITVENRQNFIDNYFGFLLAGCADLARILTGKGSLLEAEKEDVVHLDIQVEPQTAEFLTAMGEKLGHPPGRMAGRMLKFGVLESDWVIRLVAAPMLETYKAAKKVAGFGKKRKPETT